MTTITYWADGVPAARDWYRDVLGIDAYFQRPDAEHPAYVEFRVGDHQHGAVTDPFGNILGVMYNPHWLAMLAHDADQPTTAPTERRLA